MNSERISGYLVEVDHERGTFTLHSTWVQNIILSVVGLGVAAFFGMWGVAAIGCMLWGTPGIPQKDWSWYHWGIFGALAAVAAVVGLACFWTAGRILLGIITLAARGFPPRVIDREAGCVREGNQTLFELNGVDSISVVDSTSTEGYYAVIGFRYKDGQVREWSGTTSQNYKKCERLAHAVADFLGIPVTSQAAGPKVPIPEV